MASLEEFVLTACSVELGLEVPGHPQSGDPVGYGRRASGLGLSKSERDDLVAYARSLPAPVDRGPTNALGKKVFESIGCADCHVPKLGDVEGIMKAITIELPDDLPPRLREAPEALGREMRLAAAIRWLRLGRISPDEAAEIAGLGRAEFDAALAEGALPAGAESEPPGRPFSPEEAEAHYRVLGAWKGPSASKDVQRAAREFWLASGTAGARWLVGRLRDEVLVEPLHAAAALLADLGQAGIGPIVEGLLGDPSHDQASGLLKALGWLGESDSPPRLEGAQAELILADRLQYDDPDMREAAACAMRLIRPERAVRWLEHRLRDETDSEVRRTIEEELSHHRVRRS